MWFTKNKVAIHSTPGLYLHQFINPTNMYRQPARFQLYFSASTKQSMNTSNIKTKAIARILLGAFLVTAGISHLTFARKAFRAQVPDWVPINVDDTVVISGIAEIALGAALIAPGKYKTTIGKTAALFFTAVFPGNISQYVNKRNSFGLNTNNKRLIRLFFQPLLVYWAVKSTEQ